MDEKQNFLNLPSEFHEKHSCCWDLVSLFQDFITNPVYQKLTYNRIELSTYEKSQLLMLKDKNEIEEFLFSIVKEDENYILRHTVYALIMDNCYFLQEALICSLKRRLIVTFSLLRRPLVDNLVLFIRMITEEDFFDKFSKGNEDGKTVDLARKPKDIRDRLKRLEMEYKILIKPDKLYSLVFDINNPNSIINYTNRALHPITDRQKAIDTGTLNLNFSFSTMKDDIKQWNMLYDMLIPILIFYIEITDYLVFKLLDIDIKKSKRLELKSQLYNSITKLYSSSYNKD